MLRHIGLLYEEVHSSCGYPELCGGGVIHENVVKRKPEPLRRNLRNAPIVLNLTVNLLVNNRFFASYDVIPNL